MESREPCSHNLIGCPAKLYCRTVLSVRIRAAAVHPYDAVQSVRLTVQSVRLTARGVAALPASTSVLRTVPYKYNIHYVYYFQGLAETPDLTISPARYTPPQPVAG